jgi:hypothetical protein
VEDILCTFRPQGTVKGRPRTPEPPQRRHPRGIPPFARPTQRDPFCKSAGQAGDLVPVGQQWPSDLEGSNGARPEGMTGFRVRGYVDQHT